MKKLSGKKMFMRGIGKWWREKKPFFMCVLCVRFFNRCYSMPFSEWLRKEDINYILFKLRWNMYNLKFTILTTSKCIYSSVALNTLIHLVVQSSPRPTIELIPSHAKLKPLYPWTSFTSQANPWQLPFYCLYNLVRCLTVESCSIYPFGTDYFT